MITYVKLHVLEVTFQLCIYVFFKLTLVYFNMLSFLFHKIFFLPPRMLFPQLVSTAVSLYSAIVTKRDKIRDERIHLYFIILNIILFIFIILQQILS